MRIAQANPNEMEREPRIGHERGRSSVAGMVMKTCWPIAAFLAVMVGMSFRSMADLPLVYDVENTGTNYPAPPLPTLGNLPLIQPLPDPFAWAADPFGSTRSTNFADWEHRRNEIAAQIQNYEIGTKPAVDIPTQVTASYSGGTTPGTSGTLIVHVTANGYTLNLTNAVSIPSTATAPYPICIGMDSPYGFLNASGFTSRGIAGVTYSESQVSTYGSPSTSNPYYQLYLGLNPNNTGQYSAWAWGVSRLIDGLELVTNTLPIDLKHICVTGCSYAGKLALFAGAFDERIALTIAQESGGGGATSWRYSHTEPSGSVEDIDNTDYNWFKDSMIQFSGNNVSYLPEDHHELMAMCAPRALFVTANPGWTWLSNPSCYVCSRACQKIYDTLGISDRFGYNIVGGHYHCATTTTIDNEMGAFLDKFMLGNTNVNTTIRDYDSSYDSINYARWYAWWGTTNPFFPQIQLSVPATATEGDGVLAGQGSVTINPATTSNLVVSLTSSNTNKVTVPPSMVIPAGQTNAVFDLTIVVNTLLDEGQVSITATAPVYGSAQATILVHTTNTATLSVTLPATATKGAGTLANAGLVSASSVVAANYTVSLVSSDTSKLTVPSSVVISAGQSSAPFNLTVLSDTLIDGPQVVSVTAHVPTWTDGTNSMTILDDNPLPDHFVWSVVPSPQTNNQPFNVTITAYDAANNQVNYMLPVNLSAWAPGSAPATNTVLGPPVQPDSTTTDPNEYTMGYSFTPSTNLVVTSFRYYFGDKVSLWTDSGVLLASQNVVSVPGTWLETPLAKPVVLLAGATYRIGVHENGGAYYFDDTIYTSFPDGIINSFWYAIGDTFPTNADTVSDWVDLRYGTNVNSVSVSPVVSGNFNYGTWSGSLAVLEPAINVTLQSSVSGQSGQSLPFDVALGAPTLSITNVGGSVVISWLVAATGFTLEQTSDLSAGSWTAVTNSPVVVGSNYVLTNTPTATTMFYRLHKP